MIINKLNLVYFSATYSTKKILHLIAKELSTGVIEEFDITQGYLSDEIHFDANELLLIGIPVYSGRVPQVALDALHKFKGCTTPAIIVCVYGNRDYDDALLELKDIVETNGCKVISAGAFIAKHSIFPQVASDRPDAADKAIIIDFARNSLDLIHHTPDISLFPEINVKGNVPYKAIGKIPLRPSADRKCDKCGTCSHLCPTNAIDPQNPKKTNKKNCISCARCIKVCPQHARQFGGILYRIVGKKFIANYSERKEIETIFAGSIEN